MCVSKIGSIKCVRRASLAPLCASSSSGAAEPRAGTFDVTEKTDLEDLAERIEATVREANCRRVEMRAVDAEGRVIDHLIYRTEQAALAQVVGPSSGLLPYEVNESITAALRSHRSFTMLGLKGIAEGQEQSKQIITVLMNQNTALVDALAHARRERTEEVAAIRGEAGTELARLRKENSELRERIDMQWEMEDELRSRRAESQVDLEKTKFCGRLLGERESIPERVVRRLEGSGPNLAKDRAARDQRYIYAFV
jgi:hypothetical protein